MKVAIISRGKPTPEYPINGIFEFDQAKALANQGIDVAFIAIDFRIWSDKRKYGLFQYECEGVHIFELSLPLNVYRRAIPVLQQLLLIPFRAMLNSFGKPNIIHSHFYSIAAIASIIKKKYNIPFIITEHSSKLNKPAEQISKIDKRLVKTAYRHCDQLICVSKSLQQNIIKNFGHSSIVIPNMVDNLTFIYHEQLKSDTPFTFVSVGNLIHRKGFDLLINAFAELSNDNYLYIIGDGEEKTNLMKQIGRLGISSRIELLGRLDRLKINDIFQKSHAFVLPSRRETFGVVYIEAMFAGLPVIATPCGGPEEFVDESNGILVPIDDKASLVDAMLQIREHYSEYHRQNISENCFQKFSPNAVAQEIIKVYQQYC